ncbi:MAG: adenylate/guanylate cyclase domain-containing protein, partial [Candidatus Riflebacteria bacterium]|nr:adenylate/guanylate cyclase domain-containing protein [Candidatus Riflebacteria bacterium]
LLEVAADPVTRAREARVRLPSGEALGAVELAVQTTDLGNVHYGELVLEDPPRRLVVELFDSAGARLGHASCLMDLQSGRAFPAPLFQGLSTARTGTVEVPGFGPKGAERFPRAVNLLTARLTGPGIVIDLLLDDRGLGRALLATSDSGSGSVRAVLKPIMERPDSPRRGQVTVPLGTSRISFGFFDSDENELVDYACELDLGSLTFVVPRPEEAPVSREPGIGELLAEAALSEPGPGEPEGPDPEEARAPAPPPKEGLIGELRTFVTQQTALRARPPRRWPASVGEDGVELGPAGILFQPRMVTLLSIHVGAERAMVDLCLDDGGVVAAVAVARDGQEIGRFPITRATPMAPVRITVAMPAAIPEGLLICLNRHGEALPNLSAWLDVARGRFQQMSPDPAVWHPGVRFAAPLDPERTRCCVCQAPVRPKELVTLERMLPAERHLLRESVAPTPESRGACPRCFETVRDQLSQLQRTISLGWSLGLWSLTRLALATVGALLVHCSPGRTLARAMMVDFGGFLDPWNALVVSAVLWAVAAVMTPWELIVGPAARAIGRMIKTGRWPDPIALMPLMAVLALAWLVPGGFQPLPGEHAGRFLHEGLPLAVVMGFFVGSFLVRLTGYAVELEVWTRREMDRSLTRLGELTALLNQMLQCQTATELESLLEAILRSVFGAREMTIFSYDAAGSRYLPTRCVGRSLVEVSHLKFTSGDGSLAGQAAHLGRALSVADARADKELARTVAAAAVPGLIAVPLGARGRVEQVINVAQVRDPDLLERLAVGLPLVTEMFARAQEAIQRLRSTSVVALSGEAMDGLYREEALKEAFGRHLPPDLLRQLEERPEMLALTGELAEISVAVVDIVGFREMMRGLQPQAVVSLVNQCFGALSSQALRFEGYVDKFVGDSMIVVFGRPRPHHDHAHQAIVASGELLDTARVVSTELASRLPAPLSLRIGVASGQAVVGNLGSPDRFNYSCLGQPIEQALALERLARRYRLPVLVSGESARRVAGRLSLRWVDSVRPPGLDEGISIFAPLGSRPGHETEEQRSTLVAVERARTAYENRSWADAARAFEAVLELMPGDRAATDLARRCTGFATQPPPEGWDGFFAIRPDEPGR